MAPRHFPGQKSFGELELERTQQGLEVRGPAPVDNTATGSTGFVIIEFCIWFTFAVLALLPIFIKLMQGKGESADFDTYFGNYLAAFTFVIIPVLFKVIFDDPPAVFLRSIIQRKMHPQIRNVPPAVPIGGAAAPAALQLHIKGIEKDFNPRQLLSHYAMESTFQSYKMLKLSSLQLFFGLFFAVVGLFIFYIRTSKMPQTSNLIDHALYLLPNFGILFFLEFLAMFFLRQYRFGVDQFRYFEAVARTRQENLVILTMFAECPQFVPTKDVLQAMNIYSEPAKLRKEESTEILEARKLQKDEIALFEKLLDLMTLMKELPKKS